MKVEGTYHAIKETKMTMKRVQLSEEEREGMK